MKQAFATGASPDLLLFIDQNRARFGFRTDTEMLQAIGELVGQSLQVERRPQPTLPILSRRHGDPLIQSGRR